MYVPPPNNEQEDGHYAPIPLGHSVHITYIQNAMSAYKRTFIFSSYSKWISVCLNEPNVPEHMTYPRLALY